MRPEGSFSRSRICSSSARISPLSTSWSYPARCSSPCSIRIRSSSSSEWPCSRACRAAVSTEMARSPATPSPFSCAGNESTSVALFFRRKVRFSSFRRASSVRSTVTSPGNCTAFFARVKKRPSACRPKDANSGAASSPVGASTTIKPVSSRARDSAAHLTLCYRAAFSHAACRRLHPPETLGRSAPASEQMSLRHASGISGSGSGPDVRVRSPSQMKPHPNSQSRWKNASNLPWRAHSLDWKHAQVSSHANANRRQLWQGPQTMSYTFERFVLLTAKTSSFCLCLLGPIGVLCVRANAQSLDPHHQQVMMAEVPSRISQLQETPPLDRPPVVQTPLPGELPDDPSVRMQADRVAVQQNPASAPVSVSELSKKLKGGEDQTHQTEGTAQITGIVSDAQGVAIPGAEVTLTEPGKSVRERKTTAANDGSFRFADLPAGRFRLIVAAPGFGAFTSSEISVMSGATIEAPKISLNIATSSSVNVFATTDQIAEAQVKEQEKQRVFGVFQNFYTSYIWKAEPMSAKQKYRLALRTIVDPTTFVVIAGVAGAEQYNGTYPGYGPGIQGYGKRYGAALADSVSGRIIGSAVLASAFHQDPRYFYQGSGSIGSRAWHALTSAVVTRGDNGKLQPYYSHLLGNLAAGALANAYHPESSRGAGLTFQTLGITTGANAIGNLFREFVLRSLEPSVPGFAIGKTPPNAATQTRP